MFFNNAYNEQATVLTCKKVYKTYSKKSAKVVIEKSLQFCIKISSLCTLKNFMAYSKKYWEIAKIFYVIIFIKYFRK